MERISLTERLGGHSGRTAIDVIAGLTVDDHIAMVAPHQAAEDRLRADCARWAEQADVPLERMMCDFIVALGKSPSPAGDDALYQLLIQPICHLQLQKRAAPASSRSHAGERPGPIPGDKPRAPAR